jgi:hypothetical protein
MDFEEKKIYSALKEDFDTHLRAPALPPLENLYMLKIRGLLEPSRDRALQPPQHRASEPTKDRAQKPSQDRAPDPIMLRIAAPASKHDQNNHYCPHPLHLYKTTVAEPEPQGINFDRAQASS